MSTMATEVYDALLSAGAPEDKARKAAEVLADYDREFAAIWMDLADVRGDMKLLKWMQGATFAGIVALIWTVLRLSARASG